MKRTTVSLSILSAALALCLLAAPRPASSQATTQTTSIEVPLETTLDNPCAGELIDFTGTMRLVIHTTATPAGTFNVAVHSNMQQVSGTGVQSGARYRFQGASTTTELSGLAAAQESTITINFRIVGPGPNNNFILQETIHLTVNANGTATATVNQIQLKCQ